MTFFLLNLLLQAQEPVKDTLSIGGVEVTGHRPPESQRSASPMQVLGEHELNDLPGSGISDALRTFSGVTIKDYGGIGGLKTVVVRSLGANHTGVFIDGVPVSDVATGQTDLSRFVLDDLQAVELFVGQDPALCQPARAYASSSIVRFMYRSQDTGVNKSGFRAGFRTGSFGLVNPSAKATFRIGESTLAGLSLAYNHAKGDYPFVLKNGSLPDTTLQRENGDITSLNMSFRTETRFNDSAALILNTWLYAADRGLPGAVIFYNHHSSQRLNNLDFSGSLSYRNKKGRKELLSVLSYTNAFLRYRDPDFLNQNGGLDNHFSQQEVYLSQAVSLPFGSFFNAGFAADLILNSLNTDQYTAEHPFRATGMASASLKATARRSEAQATLLLTHLLDRNGSATSASRTELSPSASFITLILSRPLIRLRLLFKNSFRMPGFNDLYYNLVGNPDLRPEFVNQFNGGIIYTGSKQDFSFELHADAFRNIVKDKILAVPSQNLFLWSMQNLGKADIRGVEIQGNAAYSHRSGLNTRLALNYTHQKALDVSLEGGPTYKHQIPYIPFQTFSGTASVRFSEFGFGISSLYNSHRYVLGENIPANLLHSWWTHDLVVNWERPLGQHVFSLRLDVSNLLNTQYEIVKGFPMSGRAFYLTLNFKL
jgi:outer membrane cobalamin receptor